MIACRCPDCGAGFEAEPVNGHRLLCGDSTSEHDLARLMAGTVVDCVFTSPPYAVGVDYGETYVDDIHHLRAMLPVLARLWHHLLVPGGFAVVNFGDVISGRDLSGTTEPCEYPMALEYWPVFRASDWTLWSRRVWAKPHARVHSPWAIQSNRAASDWEHIWTWKRPGAPVVSRGDYSAFGVWNSNRGEGVDVGKEVHGAGMPVVIARQALMTHSRSAAAIYDPFAGTGTTLIAAASVGRQCYAGELSQSYCDITVLR
jgi:DNA modification methylase